MKHHKNPSDPQTPAAGKSSNDHNKLGEQASTQLNQGSPKR